MFKKKALCLAIDECLILLKTTVNLIVYGTLTLVVCPFNMLTTLYIVVVCQNLIVYANLTFNYPCSEPQFLQNFPPCRLHPQLVQKQTTPTLVGHTGSTVSFTTIEVEGAFSDAATGIP